MDSLNNKTSLLLTIITVLLISGSVILVSFVTKGQMLDKYKTDKHTTIDVLSYSLAPMLDLYDFKQIENLISASLNYNKIKYIAVYDKNGTLIRSTTQDYPKTVPLDIENRKITNNLVGIVGNLEIGFSKAYINKRIHTVTTALGFSLMGGFVLVGLGLYGLMRRYIITPLEDLTQVVEKIDSENLSARVEIFKKDEIGTLASSFNMMAENLEQSNIAIRNSENKYRSMMEAMSDAVYISSSEFRIEYMNPALMKKVGRDAIGEYCYQVVFGLSSKCPWCRLTYIRRCRSVTFDIVGLHDNQHYQISNAVLIHNEEETSMLSMLRNTTELKTLEKQLIQAQKMESIATLAAGIAHDFNNILSAIFGYTEVAILETPMDSTIRPHLGKVLKAGERARELVEQILTFGRKTDAEKKPIQAHLIVNEVLKFLRSSLPSTIQIEQHTDVDHDTIFADATQIHQIIMNLCTNAGQAMMEAGGVLNVRLDNVILDEDKVMLTPDLDPGGYLKLTVSDTGYGMTSEVLNRIFEPYFTTKEKGTGTGLGMAVVLGILKNHHGHIEIDSEPGVGSSFQVYLPLVDDQKAVEAVVDEALPRGHECILMIDDEQDITQIGKQWLEILGYDVFTETSSTDAVAFFRKNYHKIDLIITDMTMPHMTGVELATAIKKIRADMPIILCTGYASELSNSKSQEIGVEKMVMKPLKWRELAILVREILDHLPPIGQKKE